MLYKLDYKTGKGHRVVLRRVLDDRTLQADFCGWSLPRLQLLSIALGCDYLPRHSKVGTSGAVECVKPGGAPLSPVPTAWQLGEWPGGILQQLLPAAPRPCPPCPVALLRTDAHVHCVVQVCCKCLVCVCLGLRAFAGDFLHTRIAPLFFLSHNLVCTHPTDLRQVQRPSPSTRIRGGWCNLLVLPEQERRRCCHGGVACPCPCPTGTYACVVCSVVACICMRCVLLRILLLHCANTMYAHLSTLVHPPSQAAERANLPLPSDDHPGYRLLNYNGSTVSFHITVAALTRAGVRMSAG